LIRAELEVIEADNLEWRVSLDARTGGQHDVYESNVVRR